MTADRKFIACDPADLAAVLNKAEDWAVRGSTVVDALARLRADLARAFTVEEAWQSKGEDNLYTALARRLSPPAEHKVTMVDDCVECLCGWSGNVEIMDQDGRFDPFEPARLAREHLAEHGEDR